LLTDIVLKSPVFVSVVLGTSEKRIPAKNSNID